MLNLLLLTGIAILLGFLIGKGTHFLKITGVVGYIATGIILGPEVLNLISLSSGESEFLTNIALGFVAFIIGGELTFSLMRRMSRSIVAIILGESFGAFFVVFLGVYFFTRNLPLSLLFAAMAPASAPAGTVAVIHEYKAKGRLTNAILAVVGFDDGLAVLIYAFSIAVVTMFLTGVFSLDKLLIVPVKEIGGAVLIGFVFGVFFAFILKNLIDREELTAISLAAILITAGLSIYFQVSLILACMIMGMTVINLYPNDNKPVFEHIKAISLPVYIIFFIAAGLNLHFELLLTIGVIGLVYVICRCVGLIGGSYLAALVSNADPVIRNNIGFGILSQAGVAIGLSLLAFNKLVSLGLPELGTIIVTTIAATTIIFEIMGPLLARYAIFRSGEVAKK